MSEANIYGYPYPDDCTAPKGRVWSCQGARFCLAIEGDGCPHIGKRLTKDGKLFETVQPSMLKQWMNIQSLDVHFWLCGNIAMGDGLDCVIPSHLSDRQKFWWENGWHIRYHIEIYEFSPPVMP